MTREAGRETRVEEGGIRVWMVRGRPGPSLWIWVPAGAKAPSMLQAAAELRDALDPALLRGQVGFLLDGPLEREDGSVPLGGETLARLTDGAVGVIALVEGPGEQAPRFELDVGSEAARALARKAPVPLLVRSPRLESAPPLRAPLVTYVDGNDHHRSTLDREVRSRARRVLEALVVRLGLAPETIMAPSTAPLRLVIKTRVLVERKAEKGTAETLVQAGDIVRADDVVALIGPAGGSRAEVRSPVSGVVLSVDRSAGGPNIVVGKLARGLALAERKLARSPSRLAIGWCEWVSLPALGVTHLRAKVDTGARTSALHIVSLRSVSTVDESAPSPSPRASSQGAAAPLEDPLEGGRSRRSRHRGRPGELVEIEVPTGRSGTVLARCVLVGHATVRDSGGHLERRPVIETDLVFGGLRRRIRVSLTDRGDMLFPMLIGRTALDGDVVVDPASRFRLGGMP